MSRFILRTTIITAVLAVGAVSTANAQVRFAGGRAGQPGRFPGVGNRSVAVPRQAYQPAQRVYYAQPQKVVVGNGQPAQARRTVQGYPYLNAPL